MSDVNLRILMSAIGGSSVISAVSSIASSLGSGGLGGALIATGVAAATLAVGLGVTSVKAAGDFQSSINLLTTSAGESQKNLKMVGDGILKMAVDTGTSTQQLSAGMYMVESSGAHGSQALQVLSVAARGARSEGADLNTVTNALTTTMTDYHMKTSDAANAMNGLIATVSSGKTHLQDLSSAMGVVLPLASSIHVGFSQVGAAMATMTNNGESARHAAQMVAFMLRDMVAPSSVATKAMKAVGLSASDVANTLQHQGLPQALQLIEDHVGKKFPAGSAEWTAAMKQVMGGALGLNGALQIGGEHMATFTGNVANISKAMADGKNGVMGWDVVQSSFNFKMSQAKEVLETLTIKIGTALLPVVGKLMDFILPLITHFSDWVTKSGALNNALSGVSSAAKMFAPVLDSIKKNILPLVLQFAAWAQKNDVMGKSIQGLKLFLEGASIALQFMIPIIAQIIKAVAQFALEVGTRLLPIIQQVVAWFQKYWPALAPIVTGVFNEIKGIIQIAWALITGIVKIALDLISGNWKQAWTDLVDMAKGVWEGFKTYIKGAIDGITGLVNGVLIHFGLMKSGVQQNVDEMRRHSDVQHTAMKVSALTQTQGMAMQNIAHMEQQKKGILAQIAQTKDPVQRGMLEMKLQSISAAEGQERGVVAAAQKQKIQALQHIQQLKDQEIEAHKNIWQHSYDWANKTKNDVVLAISGMVAKVSSTLSGWVNNIGQWFGDRFKQASDGVKAAFNTVGAFFSGIWKGIQQTFSNVGSWFSDKFKQVGDGVKSGFGAMGNWFQQQGNNIKTTATNIGKGVVDAFNWMYAHNTYFKAMVDGIKSIAISLGAWLIGAWNSIKNTSVSAWNAIKSTAITVWTSITAFITGLWQKLSATARSVWSAVSSAIMSVVNAVVGWLRSVWAAITTWIGAQWHSLTGLASAAWSAVSAVVMSVIAAIVSWLQSVWSGAVNNLSSLWHSLTGIASSVWAAVTGVFQNAWSGISSALSGLWSNISNWFSGLEGQMVQFGQNLINSLAQGITNAAGAVSDAASGVAKNIASFLGFHSPAKQGPASDADKWMPNFVTMLSSGLLTAQPILQSAITATAKSLTVLASIADPSTVADQLSFAQAPTSISRSIKAPVATKAVKKETAQDKKEAAAKAAAAKKEAAQDKKEAKKEASQDKKEAAKEKKMVNVDIKEIKHELHIHATNAKLTHAQVMEIIDEARKEFNSKIADEIRAQFGNI